MANDYHYLVKYARCIYCEIVFKIWQCWCRMPISLDWYQVSDRLHHQMETFSALLALCAGNSPVSGEFPAQRPVTRSFDVFFDLRLINGWVNTHEAGDLRRYRVHYDVIVMFSLREIKLLLLSKHNSLYAHIYCSIWLNCNVMNYICPWPNNIIPTNQLRRNGPPYRLVSCMPRL